MTEHILRQWAAESAAARFTPDRELAGKQTDFHRRVRRRNVIEYIAGSLVIAVFAWTAWLTAQAGEIVITLGWLCGIVGIAVVMTNLYHRAGNLPHRPEADCRSHLRAQFEHQRQALASVPRWYLAPLLPGVVLIIAGSVLPVAREAGWLAALAAGAGPTAIVVGLFGAVAWLNRRAARMLEREIEALDTLA